MICHPVYDEVYGTVQYDQHLEDLADDVGHVLDGYKTFCCQQTVQRERSAEDKVEDGDGQQSDRDLLLLFLPCTVKLLGNSSAASYTDND